MFQANISDSEFSLFKKFIYDNAGINLSNQKKTLVTSRLAKRLFHHSFNSFQEYFDLVSSSSHDGERQVAIDLLTTNETYFFREAKHFSFLEHEVLPGWKSGRKLRVWSAASSTGEEAYSIAMLLEDMLGDKPWEIVGSDISSRVIKVAQQAHYQQTRIDGIPKSFLHKYCLKGIGEHEGTLLIDKKLRSRVSFLPANLKHPPTNIGKFDIVFLRNVLIYFDMETKRKIIKKIVEFMNPGAYLFIGHSESIKGIDAGLEPVISAVYRKK